MAADDDIFDSEVHTTTEGVSPEAPEGRPRDEGGRFAPKDKGEAPPTVEDGAPPAPAEKQSHMVPLSAVLDDREKRQRAEQERDQLRMQLAQLQRQPMPDPNEDPEGYFNGIQSGFEQRLQVAMLGQSRILAERDPGIGKSLVDEMMSFFDEQPYEVSARFLNHPLPFHAAAEWYQQHKISQERSSPDFEANLRAKVREELLAEMGQPSPSSARVPRSLATAGSAAAPTNPSGGGRTIFD